MDDKLMEAASMLVPRSFLSTAKNARENRNNAFRILIDQRKLPADGWPEHQIEAFLHQLSTMDSNNFTANCGVGEREARVVSGLVSRRHYHLGHGVGRSGDLAEPQPKAAGSSMLSRLTSGLALDALRAAGLRGVRCCLVVPMATGMTMTLCLLTLRHRRPGARYVIWPRIDQKSCFKAIVTAGFEPLVVENQLDGDELRTDVAEVERMIVAKGADNILCILSTTSCFAPRGIDQLDRLAALCRDHGIPHLVNNAYGVQSSKCLHELQQAARTGRVDLVVQSTDKNFMVPVGGAIVAGFDQDLITAVSKNYPGRASASPAVDLLITLLELGVAGWTAALQRRKRQFTELQQRMLHVAEKHGERLLVTRNNPISIGMTLTPPPHAERSAVTQVGAMLFTRCVSGTRVIAPGDTKTIAGHTFHGWGAHHNSYPCAYLTAAAAIGMTDTDVDFFVQRLDKVLTKWKSSLGAPPREPSSETGADSRGSVSESADSQANSATGRAKREGHASYRVDDGRSGAEERSNVKLSENGTRDSCSEEQQKGTAETVVIMLEKASKPAERASKPPEADHATDYDHEHKSVAVTLL